MKRLMLKRIRIALETVFFIGTALLFLDFTGLLHHYLGWMAKVQLLPAVLALNVVVVLALIILTLIFGRIYCSVICPLGSMQDIVWAVGNRFHKKNRTSYSREKRVLRYGLLVVFIILLVAGFTGIAVLLAPYSSFGRIAQNLLQPVYISINNVLAAIAEHADSYAFYHREVWLRSLPTFIVAAVTFVVIAVMAWRGGRTYCNTICPVGTVLSFFSRWSWLRIYFDEDKCRHCSLCTKNCKASCIDHKTMTVDHSRCVTCGVCLTKCNFGALHYGHKKPSSKVPDLSPSPSPSGRGEATTATSETQKLTNSKTHQLKNSPTQKTPISEKASSRRHFLLAAALATTAAAQAQEKKKVDGGMAKIEDKQAPERHTPITPPGSLSAQHMAQHCTACQLCVAECPNDVLRPSTDLSHFMQPVMSYERGYCRPECHRCSEVCPTGAIKPITLTEKSVTHVGHAVWIKKNCIPVVNGDACGNCARHCPPHAIRMVPLDPDDELSPEIPVVNEAICIGCGACENLCPARPFSAIYVEGHEVQRVTL